MFSPHQIPLPSSSTDIVRTVFVYRPYVNPYGNVSVNSEEDTLTAKELSDYLYKAISLVYHCAPVKVFHRHGEECVPSEVIYDKERLLEDFFIIYLV